jgi:hypothetical protein
MSRWDDDDDAVAENDKMMMRLGWDDVVEKRECSRCRSSRATSIDDWLMFVLR